MHYQRAWANWKQLLAEKDDQHVLELGRELGTEYAASLVGGTAPQYDVLRSFITDEKPALERVMKLRRPPVGSGTEREEKRKHTMVAGKETDDFLFARIKLLVHDKNFTEAREALAAPGNCFAGFGGVAGEKPVLFLTFCAKMITLPRQARDKHQGKLNRKGLFWQARAVRVSWSCGLSCSWRSKSASSGDEA